ncbi:MAG TPA: DUF3040 domain-containing protein [Acidimicrobiia bacterium]|jgi:hypothetical protein
MPLNEREQRILEEIERQFYQEDPKLAQTVARTTLESVARRWQRLALVGFVVGLVVMLWFFTKNTLVAGGGFVIMLASAGWIAMNIRKTRRDAEGSSSLEGWMERARQRWRRGR